MISDRPKYLESNVPYYLGLPKKSIALDDSILPDMLKLDLMHLSGLCPVTGNAPYPSNIISDPVPEEVISYYESKNSKVQWIQVVMNVFALRETGDHVTGIPYAISLVPASRRGVVDERPVKVVRGINPDKIYKDNPPIYLGMDPFTESYILYGSFSLLGEMARDIPSDSIGFITGSYYLLTGVDDEVVAMPGPAGLPPGLSSKIFNFRKKKYFKPFKNVRPRTVWGLESPIELFLLQALALNGIYPEMQYLIFNNGECLPSYYHLWEEPEISLDENLLSSVDFYLEDQRVAIFCDSVKHHRSGKAKRKDAAIDKKLLDIGIRPLRFSGKRIMDDLPGVVDVVKTIIIKKTK